MRVCGARFGEEDISRRVIDETGAHLIGRRERKRSRQVWAPPCAKASPLVPFSSVRAVMTLLTGVATPFAERQRGGFVEREEAILHQLRRQAAAANARVPAPSGQRISAPPEG